MGTITGCDDEQDNEGEKLYQVVYEDGDEEDLTVSELHAAIELYEKEENIGTSTFLEEQVAVLASDDPEVAKEEVAEEEGSEVWAAQSQIAADAALVAIQRVYAERAAAVPQDPAPIANNDQKMRDDSSRDGTMAGCAVVVR